MDDDKMIEIEQRARRRAHRIGLYLVVGGVTMLGIGAGIGLNVEGDDMATGFGVMAGAGSVMAFAGGVTAWLNRAGDTRWMAERPQTRHDRLQADRSGQLAVFPALGLIFFVLSIGPTREVLAGEAGFGNWLSVALPVLYAWLTTSIAMGWDGQSLRNRRYLEDELTAALRARAMIAAFMVLMAGASIAVVLGFFSRELGVLALLAAITGGGATAGIRLAWLDREASRDG